MKKYLIIECEELSDQFECDADRTPVCMTDDYSTYGLGYEVYELTPENEFRCIKEYDIPLEYGIAIYKWKDGNAENTTPDVIMRQFPERERDSFALWEIEDFCKYYHFKEETPEEILREISNCGAYGEEIDNEWVVIGEYRDNRFSMGY